MSIRANSVQSLILDGVYFTAFMAFAGISLTTIARGQEPQIVQEAKAVNDSRLTDDHIDSQLNTDDNMPSGNPEESPEAKREAMMLGMKLFERRQGYILVADVAATSPAWDAGIRPGDRLLSIDTLKPKSLAPWVDDVGKVLKDTPDGKSVSASVERDGETLALRVRLPVSKAAEVRDARQEEQAIANMAAGNPQQQPLQQQGMQTAPIASGTDNTGFGTSGGGGVVGFGVGGMDDGTNNSTGTNDDRLAQSAMAQLMPASSDVRGTNEEQAAQQQNPRGAGGQVGVATFEDSGQGVNAVVLVRGLPQGTYRVGIGQGDGMTGGIGGMNSGSDGMDDGSFSNRQNIQSGAGNGGRFSADGESGNVPGRQPQGRVGVEPRQNNQQNQPGEGIQSNPNMPQGGLPGPNGGVNSTIGTGTGGASGSASGAAGSASGGAGGASLADPKAAGVLAQQLDSQLTQGQISQGQQGQQQRQQQGQGMNQNNQGNMQDGAQRFSPSNNSGGRMQTNGNANGQASGRSSDGQNFGDDGLNGGNNGMANSGLGSNSGSTQFVAEIGVLQVGANGSARVENQLEGMQVRNLAGMSVMVVSDRGQFGGGNAAQNGVVGQNGVNPQNLNAQNSQDSRTIQRPSGQVQSGNGRFVDNRPVQSNQNGTQGVVATGIIQITEGRLPNTGHESRNGVSGDNRPVDQATQEQRNRNQISDPQRDFDPSTSQQ